MRKAAPLPFTGQKRNFIQMFQDVLNENIPNLGDGWIIVDVFGGSGLLSHVAKTVKPQARVIYNDFDGYAKRLKNISDINRLRAILYALLEDYPRQQLIHHNLKEKLIKAIDEFDGFIDIDSLASWLLFSGSQALSLSDLKKKSFYNCVRKKDYESADDYLNGLEICCEDYQVLMKRFLEVEEIPRRILFVLDPPYVSTNQDAYRRADYFGMMQFLKMMHLIRPPFVIFSSEKSELKHYVNYVVEAQLNNWENLIDYNKSFGLCALLPHGSKRFKTRK